MYTGWFWSTGCPHTVSWRCSANNSMILVSILFSTCVANAQSDFEKSVRQFCEPLMFKQTRLRKPQLDFLCSEAKFCPTNKKQKNTFWFCRNIFWCFQVRLFHFHEISSRAFQQEYRLLSEMQNIISQWSLAMLDRTMHWPISISFSLVHWPRWSL